jgi:hypothetical protein
MASMVELKSKNLLSPHQKHFAITIRSKMHNPLYEKKFYLKVAVDATIGNPYV